jgi:hypothetical protein
VSFAPVKLSDPGWTVRRGQAIWSRARGSDGIAGEILVATRADGRAFVQFSKDAFPMVAAQSGPNGWAAGYPLGNRRFSGHGKPPKRIIFLQLPPVLSGLPPSKNWSWEAIGRGGWRLENKSLGESLEVYWNQ